MRSEGRIGGRFVAQGGGIVRGGDIMEGRDVVWNMGRVESLGIVRSWGIVRGGTRGLWLDWPWLQLLWPGWLRLN